MKNVIKIANKFRTEKAENNQSASLSQRRRSHLSLFGMAWSGFLIFLIAAMPNLAKAMTLDLTNGQDYSWDINLADDETLTVTVASGTATISGAINGDVGNVKKLGAGKLILSANNNYTGYTWIEAGTLTLGGPTAAIRGYPVELNGSGKFEILSGAGNKTIKNLTSSSASTEIIIGSGSTVTIECVDPCVLASKISGAGSIAKTGFHNLTLSNANNSYEEITTINVGTLVLSATGTIASSSIVTLNNSGKLQIVSGNKTVKNLTSSSATTEVIIPSGSTLTMNYNSDKTLASKIRKPEGATDGGNIIKGGNSTLTLSNANNDYTGSTTINAGTLKLDATGTIANSSSVYIGANAKLQILSGSKTVKNLSSGETSSIVDLTASSSILTITLTEDKNFYGKITGDGGIIKTAANTLLRLHNANTYNGSTTINAGTIELATNGTIANSSSVSFSGNGKLKIASGAKTVKNLYTLYPSSEIELTASSSILTINCTQTSPCNILGKITGVGGIKKEGEETLILNGDISYEGITEINAGRLMLNPNGTLTSSSGVTLNGTGRLDLQNVSKTVKNLSSSSASAVVSISNDHLLTINSTTNTIYAGKIIGEGGIVKKGTGTLTLSNVANSYTGHTYIETGTIELSGSITSSSGVAFNNSAGKLRIIGDKTIKKLSGTTGSEIDLNGYTLTLEGLPNNQGSFAGKFTGVNGKIVKIGNNTFTFAGENTATGTFTHSEGGVVIYGSNWMGHYSKASETTLTVSGSCTISGGNLTLQGGNLNFNTGSNSTLTVAGNVTASGTNTVNVTTTSPQTGYVLIQAAGGITSLTPYSLTPISAYPEANLSINAPTKLIFNAVNVPPPVLGGTVIISGETVFGQMLTAIPNLHSTPPGNIGALTYQWQSSGNPVGTNATTYTLAQSDIGNTITVTVTTANCSGSVTSAPTATVTKATQTAPPKPTLQLATTTTITLTPVTGCEYKKESETWQDSPVFDGLSSNTAYTFTQRKAETATHLPSPASESATFSTIAPTLYTITATVNNPAYGTITPSGEVKVEENKNVTFTIAPKTGYKIADVQVNGSSVGAVYTYTITNVHANGTIHAIFDLIEGTYYTITATVNNPAYGNITPAGEVQIEEGKDITFTITPNSDYKIKDVQVNGSSVGAVMTYTISDVHADGTIHVVFEEGVGIVEPHNRASLRVYPNPTTGELIINSEPLNLIQRTMNNVEIYDVHGVTYPLLFLPSFGGGRGRSDLGRLDVSHLPAGIYFLRIGDMTEKFIKE